MKIAVIGCPGSGKSTVAHKLHEITHEPLYPLDKYYWKPGWQRPDKEDFARIHHELCDRPSWIIEGLSTRNFAYRAAQADVIIFLDIPIWRCLYRIFKRAVTGYGKIRDTSATGCPERIPDREFLWYVLQFNRKHRPAIMALCERYKDEKTVFIIKNEHDLQRLFHAFEKE